MSISPSQLMRYAKGANWHSRPFSLKVKKVTWSVAMDEFILVALRTAGAAPGTNLPKDWLVSQLSESPKAAVEVSVPELKAWAGEAPASLVPDGEVPFEHQGGLLGLSVDRRKLAYILAPFPFLTVTVWRCADPTVLGFESEGGSWRAFLASLDGAIDEEPVFQAQQTKRSTSVFDLAEEVGSE